MGQLARFAAVRALSATVTLLGISIIIFVAMHLLPGGFADLLLGPIATEQARENINHEFGLDKPLPEQYVRWLGQTLQGNLGTSMVTRQPISHEIGTRAAVTGELALLATLIVVLVGVPLGIAGGLRSARRGIAAASRLGSSLMMSVPDFVLGSILVYFFSKYSLGLTVGGWVPFFQDPVTNLRAMLLPALTLSSFGIGFVMARARHATLSVLSEPYITAAVARGESYREIVRRHVMRNAAIPVVTVLAIYVGYLLGGAVIVEMLFSIPGLGRYVIESVLNRDYGIVQSGVLFAACVFVVLNMLADVVYAALDPRLGTRKGARA